MSVSELALHSLSQAWYRKHGGHRGHGHSAKEYLGATGAMATVLKNTRGGGGRGHGHSAKEYLGATGAMATVLQNTWGPQGPWPQC